MCQWANSRRTDIGGVMQEKMQRLVLKLGDAELARKLIGAGFDNPAKIRNANDRELLAVSGIGQVSLEAIRVHFPAR